MKITVLVCTRNRPDIIESCIYSILKNTYPDFEFLIVDQSTDEKSKEIAEKYISLDGRIRYLHVKDKGKSKALNLGIKNSSGDIIATTDDDCVVNQDWIEKIVEAFQRNPDVGIVFGSVVDNVALVGKKYARKPINDRKISGRLSKLLFVADGANMSIKRNIFNTLGGFDIFLGPGSPLFSSEDQDFAYRALRAGFQILCVKKIIVTHFLEHNIKNFRELELAIKKTNISLAGWLFKHMRCLDFVALLIFLKIVIMRTSRIIVYTMFERLLINKPCVVLKLYSGFFSTYWFLLGIIKSLKYPVDKTHCLYMSK